jgi:hypothetical protein
MKFSIPFVIAICGVSSCHSQSLDDAHQTGAEQTMSITGNVTEDNSKVSIKYRLHNPGSAPIVVWDVMVNQGPNGEFVDPTLAYASWEELQTLRVIRAMLPLPLDFDVAKKEVPFVRVVAPGEAIEGRIELSKPAREYNPFYGPATVTRNVACTKIHLIIGWSEQKPGMTISKRRVAGQEVLAVRGGWAAPAQRWAEMLFGVPITLTVRADNFDRRPPMK